MNKAVVYRMITMYDNLISIAEKNLNNSVDMDWGPWVPTKKCLDTMRARRIKISSGKTILTEHDTRL
mgnify:CR=1 FL=1|jgi:hypothetical protein